MPEEFLSENSSIKDPIIIDPPRDTPERGWKSCQDYVESCGGLTYPDGEVNLRAAAGADPGCCTCPNCHQYFWAFGRVLQCTECGFQFESDWWAMYSYGVGDAKTLSDPTKFDGAEFRQRIIDGINARMPQRIQHPYYRYGFEHPVVDAWAEHDKLPWKQIMETV